LQLDIEFKKPVHPGRTYVLNAKIENRVDRKVTASGVLEDVSGKEVFATCSGLFICPKSVPAVTTTITMKPPKNPRIFVGGAPPIISSQDLERASQIFKLPIDPQFRMGIWPEHFVMGDRAKERWDIRRLASSDPDKAVLLVQFGPKAERNMEVVHGGAIATIMDIVCVVCARGGPTASLHTSYRKAAQLNTLYAATAHTTKVAGRKVYVKAVLSNVETGEVVAESEALMIPAQRLAKL